MGRSVVRQTSEEASERASSSDAAWGGGDCPASSGEVARPGSLTACIDDQACAAAATAGAMAEEGGVAGGGPRPTPVLTGPPSEGAHCSDRRKEEMVDDDRR